MYMAAGSKVIQEIDPLRESAQWNESFHGVKDADKRLTLHPFPEARFALGLGAHSG
jgi:hypothetical protein